MSLKLANNAFATLAGAILATDLTFSVSSGQGARFPALSAGDYFYGTLSDASGNLEIIRVTARAVDVLTVQRGQDGTAARAYSGGDRIEMRPNIAALQAAMQEALLGVAAAGTDVYTANLPLAPLQYNTDQMYAVRFGNTNTSTTPTLALNTLAAITIKKMVAGSLIALAAGDIQPGVLSLLQYNGSFFILLNPAASTAAVLDYRMQSLLDI